MSLKGKTDWSVPLTISRLPVKFGGHGFCQRGDTSFLICHVTSGEHEIKGSQTSWIGYTHYNSPPCQNWWQQTLKKEEISCL